MDTFRNFYFREVSIAIYITFWFYICDITLNGIFPTDRITKRWICSPIVGGCVAIVVRCLTRQINPDVVLEWFVVCRWLMPREHSLWQHWNLYISLDITNDFVIFSIFPRCCGIEKQDQHILFQTFFLNFVREPLINMLIVSWQSSALCCDSNNTETENSCFVYRIFPVARRRHKCMSSIQRWWLKITKPFDYEYEHFNPTKWLENMSFRHRK